MYAVGRKQVTTKTESLLTKDRVAAEAAGRVTGRDCYFFTFCPDGMQFAYLCRPLKTGGFLKKFH